MLFINDYQGSSESDCLIVKMSSGKRASVKKILFKSRFRKEVSLYSHSYVTCTSWSIQGNVDALLHAYDGDSPGSTKKKFEVDPATERLIGR